MGERVPEKNLPSIRLGFAYYFMCQGLLKRAIRMAGNDDQSLAAGNKGCSLNRSGKQRCILERWLMITHRRSAGVAHE